MHRLAPLNPFAPGLLLAWQCLLVAAFVPFVGLPIAARCRTTLFGGPEPQGSLVAVPLFFFLGALVSTALAIRRSGGGWVWAVLGGAGAGAGASLLAWLAVFWMSLVGGAGWTIAALACAVVLLYVCVGAPKWVQGAESLGGVPA